MYDGLFLPTPLESRFTWLTPPTSVQMKHANPDLNELTVNLINEFQSHMTKHVSVSSIVAWCRRISWGGGLSRRGWSTRARCFGGLGFLSRVTSGSVQYSGYKLVLQRGKWTAVHWAQNVRPCRYRAYETLSISQPWFIHTNLCVICTRDDKRIWRSTEFLRYLHIHAF